jgi:hypothetical protein
MLDPAKNDLRIKTDTRIVNECPAVDLGQVDRPYVALCDRAYRSSQRLRYSKVFRKVIQCTERQNAKGLSGACDLGGDSTDRTVTAAGDDGIGIIDGVLCEALDLSPGLCEMNIRRYSVSDESIAEAPRGLLAQDTAGA